MLLTFPRRSATLIAPSTAQSSPAAGPGKKGASAPPQATSEEEAPLGALELDRRGDVLVATADVDRQRAEENVLQEDAGTLAVREAHRHQDVEPSARRAATLRSVRHLLDEAPNVARAVDSERASMPVMDRDTTVLITGESGVGKEVVNSLTIGFPGSQQTIIGNIVVSPSGNAPSAM